MNYQGGKNRAGVYQQIINQIPPHRVYIEPFCGSGAILRLKRPATSSIAIDADAGPLDLLRSLIATSDAGFRILGPGELDAPNSVSPSVRFIHANALEFLDAVRERPQFNSHDTFIYCDPPYLIAARASTGSMYDHEFGSVVQHRQLLRCLKTLNCCIAISGYASTLYADELKDWREITFKTTNRASDVVTEHLWMNYPEPMELHDYRYLGQNYREREKIARQKKRWIARLERMDRLQRFALLNAIDQLRDPHAKHTASKMAIAPAPSPQTASVEHPQEWR